MEKFVICRMKWHTSSLQKTWEGKTGTRMPRASTVENCCLFLTRTWRCEIIRKECKSTSTMISSALLCLLPWQSFLSRRLVPIFSWLFVRIMEPPDFVGHWAFLAYLRVQVLCANHYLSCLSCLTPPYTTFQGLFVWFFHGCCIHLESSCTWNVVAWQMESTHCWSKNWMKEH